MGGLSPRLAERSLRPLRPCRALRRRPNCLFRSMFSVSFILASTFYDAALASSFLLLVNRAMLPLNDSGSTHLVKSVPDAVPISAPSMTAQYRRCPSVPCLLPGGPAHWPSPSGSSPDFAWYSSSLSVTGRMSLVGWDPGATSRWNPYQCYLLLSSEIVGRSPASLITIPG